MLRSGSGSARSAGHDGSRRRVGLVGLLVAGLAGCLLVPGPPAPVADLQASATSSSVTLTYSIPTEGFAGAVVRRAVGSVPPAGPTDGTLVADAAGPVSFVIDAGLSPSTTYSYAVFAHGWDEVYAAPATITIATTSSLDVAPAAVTDLQATPATTSIALTWTNPSADFAGATVRRLPRPAPSRGTDGRDPRGRGRLAGRHGSGPRVELRARLQLRGVRPQRGRHVRPRRGGAIGHAPHRARTAHHRHGDAR